MTYDIIIIGGGNGGLTAAKYAKKLGAKVAVVEKSVIGGHCLWTGSVPAKSLLSIAKSISAAESLSQFSEEPFNKHSIRFHDVMELVSARQKQIENKNCNVADLEKLGIDVILGDYHFKGSNSIEDASGRNKLKGRHFIIATGSVPEKPAIDGLHLVPYQTTDTIWNIKKLPKSLGIIGSEPINFELASAFSQFGSKVTLLDQNSSLLIEFDPWIGEKLNASLQNSGVKIIKNCKFEKIEKTSKGTIVSYSIDATPYTFESELLFVNVGRKSNTEGLGLANLGIKLNNSSSIIVDNKLRTSQKHIYAVGDVLGAEYYKQAAAEQATHAVIHALYGYRKPVDFTKNIPTLIFTDPEIAQIGYTEKELLDKKIPFRVAELDYSNIDSAVADGTADGKGTIIIGPDHIVLGAAIVGNMASELIGYFSNLMSRGASIDELIAGIQSYPSYSIYLKQIATSVVTTDYVDSFASKIIRRIRR